jgi:arylsulfatase
VLDGVDLSAFIKGRQDDSNRDWFPMFFGDTYVRMRYRNFKVLTHKVAAGAAPILELRCTTSSPVKRAERPR